MVIGQIVFWVFPKSSLVLY